MATECSFTVTVNHVEESMTSLTVTSKRHVAVLPVAPITSKVFVVVPTVLGTWNQMPIQHFAVAILKSNLTTKM